MTDDVVRQSQVVGVFGPGAMLDLPERSVVVGGLDKWDMRSAGAFQVIEEKRLADLLRLRLKDDPRWNKDELPQLRTPPRAPSDPRAFKPALEAPIFPQWFVCDTAPGDAPNRRRMVKFQELTPPARKQHEAEDKIKRRTSPVRFVCGCEKGHLQDIDWRRIVHAGPTGCRQQMWMEDSGTSADPRDTAVVCECGARLTLENLFQAGRLGRCEGERPWIGGLDPTPCTAEKGLRLLTRSATNTYFPQVAAVISLPQGVDRLSRAIEANWSVLQKCKSPESVASAREFNPAIEAALTGASDEEVFARIQAIRSAPGGGVEQAADPRLAEFELFSCGRKLIGENLPGSHLHAETLDRDDWDPTRSPLLRGIGSLVAVHRLREVSCLYGFTRFEPSALATDDLEDVGLAVDGAPLGQNLTWLPAVEQFGEGIFMTFDAQELGAWLARGEASHRFHQLAGGISAWEKARRARGLRADRADLGERVRPEYIMAHSLSHALMSQVALDCGYPASALKERVYVPARSPNKPPTAGLLVYTATAGNQGTLGGLVEVIHRFPQVLSAALERLRLCSNDPVCADHEPESADEDRALHGAACHGCLLLAETSCEARNLHLDRSLLTETVASPGAAFFDLRPQGSD